MIGYQPMRARLAVLVAQIEACQVQIGTLDKRIHAQHRANEASRRLETIPGIGVIGATAQTSRVIWERSGTDYGVLLCVAQGRVNVTTRVRSCCEPLL